MNLIKTIFLVRHGKTAYNDDDLLQGSIDLPISESGKKEAELLAQELQNEKFDVFFHSPLKRALQTAEIVNKHHKKPFKEIPCFSEIEVGQWEGLNYFDMIANNNEIFLAWLQDPTVEIPGGESLCQVFERVKPGVQEILASPFSHILIAAHAAVNRGILAALLNIKPEPARMFRMKNGAYSKFLVYESGRHMFTVVESWNNNKHLENIR
ncbi:MAG: histidine phosphatase family protein [Candidatus Aminicenantes bacterium]|nr:histidine phosphatase family protein [Candidatus Aminicenantes bacterium]